MHVRNRIRNLAQIIQKNIRGGQDKDKYKFAYLETVRGCPVKCVPCPVGRGVLEQHPIVLLDLDVARKCFSKLRNEYQIKSIVLGNWGEPLLHPELAKIVQIARDSGFEEIGVSTSLSVDRDMLEIANAGFDFIQVSVSGITQEVYNQAHRKGNFALVMKNLADLVGLVKEKEKRPNIALRWHRYRHNEFEFEKAQGFCKGIDIGINPYYGHLGSIEALRDWLNGTLEEPLKSFVENFVYTEFIVQALRLNNNATHCKQSEFLVIDADGTLVFCCSCYRYYKKSVDFMSMGPKDIEEFKKLNSTICAECLANGWSGYMNRPKTLEEYGDLIKL